MVDEFESGEVVEGQGLESMAPPAGSEDPGTEPEPKSTTPEKTNDPLDDVRAELVKRYGEKSDQDYVQEVWKSYRNMEKEYSKYSELNKLVESFGGPEVLKEALNAPPPAATNGETQTESNLPPDLKALVDSGYLDPNDPKDALTMALAQKLNQIEDQSRQQYQEKSKTLFEQGLEKVKEQYKFADIDSIKLLGYSGRFRGMTDAQLWQEVDRLAKAQHEKVEGLVNAEKDGVLKNLKGLEKESVLTGKSTPAKAAGKKPANEVFSELWDKYYPGS